VTSHGYERPTLIGPVEEQATIDELDRCDWDAPLTRLLLLLEIADRPTWLRNIARPAR
jgi:hypothetical protein